MSVEPTLNEQIEEPNNDQNTAKKNEWKTPFTMLLIFLTFLWLTIYLKTEKRKNCDPGYSLTDCSLECGIVYESNSFARIVGGYSSQSGSWPSMALVIFKFVYSEQAYISQCGGILIDKETVITAAHCIRKTVELNGKIYSIKTDSIFQTIESMYTVYLGVNDVNDLNGSDVQKMNVKKIIVHEDYDKKQIRNDIAIIKLHRPAKLTTKVQIACLPSEKSWTFPKPLKQSFTVGWGTTSYQQSEGSKILRYVDLKIYPSSYCSWTSHSSASQICAGDLTGNKDSCLGDSGGPLFILESIEGKLKYVSVGIVSYGYQCAVANRPGIYTRISYYYDWIKENSAYDK